MHLCGRISLSGILPIFYACVDLSDHEHERVVYLHCVRQIFQKVSERLTYLVSPMVSVYALIRALD